MTIITRACAVGLCLAVLSTAAAADTLTLRDGTRIQGAVIAFTAETLTFRGADGFARNYHTDLVATLSFLPLERPRLGGAARPDGADRREERPRTDLDVPAGAELVIHAAEMAASLTLAPGQTFVAVMEQALRDADGRVVLAAGTVLRFRLQ